MQIARWFVEPNGSVGVLAKPDFTLRLGGFVVGIIALSLMLWVVSPIFGGLLPFSSYCLMMYSICC